MVCCYGNQLLRHVLGWCRLEVEKEVEAEVEAVGKGGRGVRVRARNTKFKAPLLVK